MKNVIINGNVDPSCRRNAIILYGVILLVWILAPILAMDFFPDYDEPVWMIIFIVIVAAFVTTLLYISKCNITVTETMITGKAAFGRLINLPIDSVSAVGTSTLFHSVEVATSSGKISFVGIQNASEIASEISDLLISRQQEKNHLR